MPDASAPAEVKSEEDLPGSSGHRVLIFAQLKSYLDIVEADVLAPAGISYLRLDGRHATKTSQNELCRLLAFTGPCEQIFAYSYPADVLQNNARPYSPSPELCARRNT